MKIFSMHLNASNKINESIIWLKSSDSTSYKLSRNIIYIETPIYLNIKILNFVPWNLKIEHCAAFPWPTDQP